MAERALITGAAGFVRRHLAEKIIYLIKHRVLAKKLGANARKKFEEREYSLDKFYNKIMNLYQKVIFSYKK
jgi:glycosyltransferase involved in cell wall biosynthesis